MQAISQRKRNDEQRDDTELTGFLSGAAVHVSADGDRTRRDRHEFDIEENDTTLPGPAIQSSRGGRLQFLRGPIPPRPQQFRPLLPDLQKLPQRFVESRRVNRKVILAIIVGVWFLVFAYGLSAQLPVKDTHGAYVVNLDCTDTLWKRKNECGIDGIDCRPFDNKSFAFKCPAKCADVKLLNPHRVGTQEVNYRPLVIGADVYRADSFICASALHAGIIQDHTGGCGRIQLVGRFGMYESTTRFGIESVAFNSTFPKAFTIEANGADENDDSFECSSDPRSSLLPFSLIFTALLSILSDSPKVFFPIFVIIFAHVSFASDPPQASHFNITPLPDHISMFAKRLLPALFIAVILYQTCIKRTLSNLNAPIEKTIFWLGGFWFGALSNYTFDWIPLARLTAHDLEHQPGAKLALGIIILVLVLVFALQARGFWLEGRLPSMLALYAAFIGAILLSLLIPGVNLRIHHYILALLLLPGTTLQTRSSLFFQGILLGLFVNGVARWDFDSVLQTSDALRNDAKYGSEVPPVQAPVISIGDAGDLIARFSFSMIQGAVREGYDVDGVSVLVNDVERGRVFFEPVYDGTLNDEKGFKWRKEKDAEQEEYFRFAYVRDGRTLDYGRVGVWDVEGVWKEMGKDGRYAEGG